MRRYWVDKQSIFDGRVEFHADLFHHVCEVCRLPVGARFEVLTESGEAFLVEMREITPGRHGHAWAQILESRKIPPLPRPHLHLALSVSRFATMDAIVEKSVELGVAAFHPFFSEYCFSKQVSESKMDRWRKIVRSATQQTGRGDLMPVHGPRELKNLLEVMNRNANAKGLFAYEGEASQTLRQAVERLQLGAKDVSEVWLFVGSEGGFSINEVKWFESHGLGSTTLGSQVLRVETACVALLSVLKYHFALS